MTSRRSPDRPSAIRTSDRPTVSERDRVCSEPGCETVLSRYNADTCCWRHQPDGSALRRER